MDLAKYKSLVPDTDLTDAQINAAILKAQSILEILLGYTLDPNHVEDNQFPGLTPTKAYRIFPFNRNDLSTRIDPCTELYHVYFLRADGTTEEVDLDTFHGILDRGIITFINFYSSFFPYFPSWFSSGFINFRCECTANCAHLQLLVDAEWCWKPITEQPNDLLQVWAEMISYYGAQDGDIRSQTLGSHSYTKFDKQIPESISSNASIIARYAGPRGTAVRTITI